MSSPYKGFLFDGNGKKITQLGYFDATVESYSRKKFLKPTSVLPSSEMLPMGDRLKIIGILRRMAVNNPVLSSLIRQLSLMIGSPVFKSLSTDPLYADSKERLLEEELSNIVYGKKWDLETFGFVVNSEWAIAGEVFFAFLDSGKVQIIESEMVGSPKLEKDREKNEIDGIVYDDEGNPLKYRVGKWIKKSYGSQISYERDDSELIDAEFVYHYYNPSRVSDLRGTPPLASVIDTLVDLDDITKAKVEQVKLQSANVMAVTKNDPIDWAQLVANQANTGQSWYQDAVANMSIAGSQGRTDLMDIQNGQILALAPNEKIDYLTPQIDAGNFDSFQLSLLKRICSVLGVPVALILSYENFNYSSARSENLKFQANVNHIRKGLEHFYDKLQRWVTDLNRELLPEGETDDVLQHYPVIPEIDSESSIRMKISAIQSGLMTLQMVANESGLSADQIIKGRVGEAKQLYMELKKQADELGISVAELRSIMGDTQANTNAQTINNLKTAA